MKPKALSEKQIQATCDDFMILDGWRIIKTDLPHLRGLGVQERGMPDRCYIRYSESGIAPTTMRAWSGAATSEVLWVEFKARKGVVGRHQSEWHWKEQARGGIVWVATQEFEPTIEGFIAFYRSNKLLKHTFTFNW